MVSVEKFLETWRESIEARIIIEKNNEELPDYENDVVEYEDMTDYQKMIVDIASDPSRGEMIPRDVVNDSDKLYKYLSDGIDAAIARRKAKNNNS